MTSKAPFTTPDEFFAAVDARYGDLSKRLQSIARELHFHRDSLALMSVNELAEAMDVPPSALVRFAQSLGFSGFSQMKSLFQQNLAEQLSDSSYSERLRQVSKEQQKAVESIPGSAIVSEVIDNNIASLRDLFDADLVTGLNHAVELMENAKSIWVMAAGRSFSAAAYFTYLIRHGHKPIHWLNGLCFNLDGQISAIKKSDVLLVISYAPYAEPSLRTVEVARNNGAKIIAITDSHLNDIAKSADQTLVVREHSSFGFRSLANTVCVIQSLFLLYASHTELDKTENLQ